MGKALAGDEVKSLRYPYPFRLVTRTLGTRLLRLDFTNESTHMTS